MKELAKALEARFGTMNESAGRALTSMLSAASDIALVLDEAGVIRDVALGPSEPPIEESRAWLGQGWIETVTPESRPKIQDMLREAAVDGVSRRRHVNHLSPSGIDIPIAYTTVRLGRDETQLVALGHDLSTVSVLQQRLVEAQQSLERDYWRMRHLETRYRLLFQVSSEAVLVVDASTRKVVEVNPAAATLFDSPAKKLVGRPFPFDVDRASEDAIHDLLATVRAHGRGDELPVRLGTPGRDVRLSVSLGRQDSQSLFLVRVLLANRDGSGALGEQAIRSAQLVQALPDAFVATDGEGRVLSSNRAFLDLVEMPTEDQVRGQALSRWIGRPGADLGLMLATMREHGVVRLFGTSLQGELGSASEIEVSGALVPDGASGVQGLLIRDIGRRIALGPHGARDLTRAVEQLTGLLGRVSLKNLVRDTADLVERHFIEAALEMTEDNRTFAAEVLGVSRQSLYVKLRRYDLGPEPDTQRPGNRTSKARSRKKKR
jgi:transcriptional regulator PpsR